MLNRVKGDLISLAEAGEFDVIVHGCNCFNTMGSGVARTIRERCPTAWTADQRTLSGDKTKLGTYTVGKCNGFVVVNAYTQFSFARNSDVFEYDSFSEILEELLKQYGDKRIGFPYIGMGLAGGDKERIISMLVDFAERAYLTGGTVTLVEFC